jgi:PadR family transcriptional regulator, regulatory protein AphA
LVVEKEVTTTSFALLGLLATKPWTTYELARQMERSLRRFWPRAESNLYAAARSLVEHGLARARTEHVGRRPRVVYAITPKGRRALRRWVTEPGAEPVLEFETLVKVFYAEHGTKDDLLTHLASVKAWADGVIERGHEIVREYVEGRGPFRERLPMIMLAVTFVSGQADAMRGWAQWAEALVAGWPEDPAAWPADADLLAAAFNA